MALEETIKTALSTVSALGGRVFTAEVLPDDDAPFCFYEMQRQTQDRLLTGRDMIHHATVNIHMVGKYQEQVRSIGGDLQSAMEALEGTSPTGMRIQEVTVEQVSPDLKEKLVGLYRRVYQATLWWEAVPETE